MIFLPPFPYRYKTNLQSVNTYIPFTTTATSKATVRAPY